MIDFKKQTAKEEGKVADRLYKSIIVAIITAAVTFIVYGMFNQELVFPNDPAVKQEQESKAPDVDLKN